MMPKGQRGSSPHNLHSLRKQLCMLHLHPTRSTYLVTEDKRLVDFQRFYIFDIEVRLAK